MTNETIPVTGGKAVRIMGLQRAGYISHFLEEQAAFWFRSKCVLRSKVSFEVLHYQHCNSCLQKGNTNLNNIKTHTSVMVIKTDNYL